VGTDGGGSDWSPRAVWNRLGLRRKAAVVIAIPLAVILVGSAIVMITLQRDARADASVRHSQDVQQQIAVVDGLVVSREDDLRGYILLGGATELATAERTETALTNALRTLDTMVRDNGSQSGILAGAEVVLGTEPPIPDAAVTASPERVSAWMARESATTSTTRQRLAQLDAAESVLLSDRRATADRERKLAIAGVICLLALGVLASFAAARLFARNVARRVDRLEDEVGSLDVDDLTQPPDDSDDELGVLSRRVRTTIRALASREAELGGARVFLENILVMGPVVVLRRTHGGEATYVSPNCERVLGISPDDALAADFVESATEPGDYARFMAATNLLFEPGGPAVVEFEGGFRLGGRYRYRYLSCIVTRETADSDHGLLIYLLDVTERHNAQREVAERQRELSAITTASPDVIIVYGADLRVRFVSEAITTITGMKSTDLIGQKLGEFAHDQDRPRLLDAVRAVISGAAEDFTVRVRVRHASGRFVTLEGHGKPLLGSDGAPTAAVAIFRDVSDRIELEAALVEARDIARAASGAKSEFLSRMSHELRTPLNVVLGFAQLLQMEQLDHEHRSWVDQVLRAGRHLLDLINEVLDIARIESGALALSPEPVSLRDVVGEAVESLRPVAAANDVSLDYLVEGDDLYVHADRQRLLQVLFNLLANAAKYNRPNGTVLVTCRLRGAGSAEIRVSDTGIGIAAEHIERLFVPFDRLGAENSMIEGTGVGLSLSLRLVQAMEGELYVESEPGEGSTFIVVLPHVQSPSESAGVTVLPADGYHVASGPARPRGDVLYIESSLTNLSLMQRLVDRRPGVTLLHASDGQVGIAIARGRGADLILLDLQLPDMSGVDVLDQLRADPATSGIPVYVVSADATASQVVRMTSAGAAGYLTKPLDVRRVLALLDELLNRRVPANEGEGS
jgi:PAS domain S-box-containing protein